MQIKYRKSKNDEFDVVQIPSEINDSNPSENSTYSSTKIEQMLSEKQNNSELFWKKYDTGEIDLTTGAYIEVPIPENKEISSIDILTLGATLDDSSNYLIMYKDGVSSSNLITISVSGGTSSSHFVHCNISHCNGFSVIKKLAESSYDSGIPNAVTSTSTVIRYNFNTNINGANKFVFKLNTISEGHWFSSGTIRLIVRYR